MTSVRTFNKHNRFWQQRQDTVTFVRDMKHEITENDSTSPGMEAQR